ncbi:CDP-glycerol glycerophosphotransferase family protein, partial [Vibrio breoganii]|uniref:CDP-glycerol glycerophosphotransferase family protein n=1 Tax=Vibrio breoganii TaxID=553239 RepID=UPI001A7E0EE4
LINTNFDYFLSTTEFYSSVIQKSFGCNADRVIIAPQPRMSALKNEFLDLHRTEIFKNNKNILYAPTWRRNGKLKLFTFWSNISSLDDFLVKHETVIWLRLHPHFEFDTDISSLRNIRLFSGKEYPDINQYLYVFDGLITDYSSVFLDFLFFNRPIYFSEYDKKEYINDNGIISNSGKVKPENPLLNEIDFQEMLYQINRGNSVNYTEFNKNANYVIDNENDDNCRVLQEILNSKFY